MEGGCKRADVSWRDRRDHEYGNHDRWVQAGFRAGHFPITNEKRKSPGQIFGRNVSLLIDENHINLRKSGYSAKIRTEILINTTQDV